MEAGDSESDSKNESRPSRDPCPSSMQHLLSTDMIPEEMLAAATSPEGAANHGYGQLIDLNVQFS